MLKLFTFEELVILLAGLCWLLSLPLLAAGNTILWFGAQGLYGIGMMILIWRHLVATKK